jgi:hypothetical protein
MNERKDETVLESFQDDQKESKHSKNSENIKFIMPNPSMDFHLFESTSNTYDSNRQTSGDSDNNFHKVLAEARFLSPVPMKTDV